MPSNTPNERFVRKPENAASREEEPCFDCGGSGWDQGGECMTCGGTGLVYTEQAIRDQVAVEEEHRV